MDESCPGCPRCGAPMFRFGEPTDGWITWLCPLDDEVARTVGNRKWIRERIAQALQAAYREGLEDGARQERERINRLLSDSHKTREGG